ncbi:hypothetical protein EG028_03315 [Chitinophaga barathri]|uniref:Uncharacterized protein n=1 Tax=Chitinophaga barathri TaxID=1647451 RepID=A0A3N4N3N0_9BACT|nr:hypothetical protein EG028_03315 [Chitinophaga barathri]
MCGKDGVKLLLLHNVINSATGLHFMQYVRLISALRCNRLHKYREFHTNHKEVAEKKLNSME